MDLTAFLAARLDEKEAAARYASPAKIAWLTIRDASGQMLYTTVAAGRGDSEDVWVANGTALPVTALVRVVYDPARALREVAAGRAILAEHRQWAFGGATGCSVCHAGHEVGDPSPGPCPTLRVEGAVDSGHPDYDPDWAPELSHPAGAGS